MPLDCGPSTPYRATNATAMVAHARLATECRNGGTVVSELRSEAPLSLRLTNPKPGEPWDVFAADLVWVCLSASAAGPVGGDRLTLDVNVGPDSSLALADVSSTLLLPGPHGRQSHTKVDIRVAAGGTLMWLPEPVIAARNCHHHNEVRVQLDSNARLLIREELLLGRHSEAPGMVQQSIRVCRAGTTLYHQQLTVGGDSPWGTPAVIGNHRAVGSLLMVDAAWTDAPPPGGPVQATAAVLPLTGPAAVVTALGSDSLQLRRGLTAGLTALVRHRSSIPEEDQ